MSIRIRSTKEDGICHIPLQIVHCGATLGI